MIEQKALAYVNMYGVLGSLENLCSLDAKAKEICRQLKAPVSLCFSVKGGPTCTFHFTSEGCRMEEGDAGCSAKMNFSSPEAFNDLINHSKPGLPVKGIVKTLGFLTGPFTKLTDRLNEVLRPKEEALKDPAFFEENTLMTLYVIAGAVSALANNDPISRISAGGTVDGDIQLSIPDKAVVTFRVKDHCFKTVKAASEKPRATMEFANIEIAGGLFSGKVSALNEMCRGTIRMAGMIPMIDNLNRILDRVSVYLA